MQFLPEIIGFIVLGFAWGAQLRLRSFLLEHRRLISFGAGALVFGAILLLSWIQYDAWRIDPVSKFLLPPHQSISYFVLYLGRLVLLPWAIAAVSGWIGMILARKLNNRYDGRFFEEEEPFLFGLSIFCVGYPGLLLYIGMVFLVGLIATIGYTALRKGRAPLYYIWLPTALLAILSKSLVFNKTFWAHFNF